MIYRDDWLAQVQEEALAPELEICDPHHHWWSYPQGIYMLAELLGDIRNSGHRVTSTVFVDCMSGYRQEGPEALRPVGETEFVRGVVRNNHSEVKVAAGIVGFADLTLGDAVDEVLQAHIEAGENTFRGIRHATGWSASEQINSAHTNPDQGLMASKEFCQGFARLGAHNLSYDAWLYHGQIGELADLAQAFSDTPIVLDHLGGLLFIGPDKNRAEQIYPHWKKAIDQLAAYPNVHIKLGGVSMVQNGFDWHERDKPMTSDEYAEFYRPWYLHCIESLGVERCMFESNFPMDRASCSYQVLWNGYKKMVVDFSDAEKRALFCDTAARFYRLEL